MGCVYGKTSSYHLHAPNINFTGTWNVDKLVNKCSNMWITLAQVLKRLAMRDVGIDAARLGDDLGWRRGCEALSLA